MWPLDVRNLAGGSEVGERSPKLARVTTFACEPIPGGRGPALGLVPFG